MRRSLLYTLLTFAAPPVGAQPVEAQPCVARDPVTAEINAREGIRLAKAEQFAAAEALFATAARLDPCMPKYPYLLGRAHDRQDDFEEAEAAYTAVMQRFPTSVEFTKAEGALLKLRARRAEAERAAAEAAREAEAVKRAEEAARRAEAARAAESARKAREVERVADAPPEEPPGADGAATVDGPPLVALGWLTAGLGVAAIGAGVGFSLAAQDADEELTLAATRPDRARYDALFDDRETWTTLGWVGYGVGGALALGGVAMLLLADGPAPTAAPTAGGAVLGVSGRF